MFHEPDDPVLAAAPSIVLKIGGSIARNAETLRPVLDVLGRSHRPIVVVAGGGAFADAVRDAQPRLGFSDETAHRMALLALHQNAVMMASFVQRLQPIETLSEIRSICSAGGAAIWLPLRECQDDPLLPANWQATSDAVAARLAERLGWPIGFIKSRPPICGQRTPQALVDDGLIDPVAGTILERSDRAFTAIAADELQKLAGLVGTDLAADAAADCPH